jgi:NSS family neurotransmitter:Na+ symporter
MEQPREHWGSRTGFILAALGSAIGLANIVKFPYVVGANGGAAFVLLYLFCLALVGFPVLVAEVLIGRTAQTGPASALQRIGGGSGWRVPGRLIVLTGFIVSAFYSVLAGWILGYLLEAVKGNVTNFSSPHEANAFFQSLKASPLWTLSFHGAFMFLGLLILFTGVRDGIERYCKWLMPLLFLVLTFTVIQGLCLEGSWEGVRFLFNPDFSEITPAAVLIALGQAFFTVSVGQGTMITYGSYLPKGTNVVGVCLPIVLADTLISLMAAVAVFSIVFSAGMQPNADFGLIFQTLPVVFGTLPGGYFMALFFFLLISVAALTSQISAMEPVIAYLMDERGWGRHRAAVATAVGAFLVGVPCALSSNILSDVSLFGYDILGFVDFVATSILIPLGGLIAVVFVSWRWGFGKAYQALQEGDADLLNNRWVKGYFKLTLQFGAPLLIILVFLSALGLFTPS